MLKAGSYLSLALGQLIIPYMGIWILIFDWLQNKNMDILNTQVWYS
jgi:hypothetical protein